MSFNNSTCVQSALLDITSTTKGLLIPRMTTVQRTAIASPAEGLQVYDTDAKSLYFYNATTWLGLGTGASYAIGTLVNTIPLVGTGGVVADRLCASDSSGGGVSCNNLTSSIVAGSISDESGSGALLFGTSPTISNPVISNIAPAGNFTLTQNAVVPFTSESSGAVADTLYLKAGKVGIGTTTPTSMLSVGSISNGGNVVINGTEGVEIAPTLEAANWTVTGGASAGAGFLNLVGASSATPSGALSVTAGRIYKVVITVTASANYSYYTLGGTEGREPFGTATYTEYLTATNTSKISIVAVGTGTTTIASLSIKEMTPNSGDFINYGKLMVVNGLFDKSGTKVIDINSSGAVGIGTNASNAGYKLSIGGIMKSSGYYAPYLTNGELSYLYMNEANYTSSFKNSTNQSIVRVYNTSTDASNYERMSLTGVAGTSVNLTAETAGTGGDNLNIVLTPAGTGYTLLNGNVGIGITAPTYQLQLSTDSAAKPGTSTWTIASDARLKDIRAPFLRGLDAMEGIHPIYFRYKAGNELGLPTDKEYVGIIAQDAKKVVPEAVQTDGQGFLHVTNDSIIWTMFNGVKELYGQFKALVARVINLEDKDVAKDRSIASMKKENAELKVRADKVEKENTLIKNYLCAKDSKASFCK